MNGFFGGKAGGARRGVDFPSDENWSFFTIKKN
jgi:hypothetical protein